MGQSSLTSLRTASSVPAAAEATLVQDFRIEGAVLRVAHGVVRAVDGHRALTLPTGICSGRSIPERPNGRHAPHFRPPEIEAHTILGVELHREPRTSLLRYGLVAYIATTIVVAIGLIAVVDGRAVVAGVPDPVAVAVALIPVGGQGAVVVGVRHTIPVPVRGGGRPVVDRVTDIADAIAVVVGLVAVGHVDAVVDVVGDAITIDVTITDVTDTITVQIGLISVALVATVVVGIADAVAVRIHGGTRPVIGEVAGITQAVTIGVALVGVVHVGTVVGIRNTVPVTVRVTGVADAILIHVLLVGIGVVRAVVLEVGDAIAVGVDRRKPVTEPMLVAEGTGPVELGAGAVLATLDDTEVELLAVIAHDGRTQRLRVHLGHDEVALGDPIGVTDEHLAGAVGAPVDHATALVLYDGTRSPVLTIGTGFATLALGTIGTGGIGAGPLTSTRGHQDRQHQVLHLFLRVAAPLPHSSPRGAFLIVFDPSLDDPLIPYFYHS